MTNHKSAGSRVGKSVSPITKPKRARRSLIVKLQVSTAAPASTEQHREIRFASPDSSKLTGANLLARDLATTTTWKNPGYLNQFDTTALRTCLKMLVRVARASESWLDSLENRVAALDALPPSTSPCASTSSLSQTPPSSPVPPSCSSFGNEESPRVNSQLGFHFLSDMVTLTRTELLALKNELYNAGFANALNAVGDEKYAAGFAAGADAGFYGGWDAGFAEGERRGWAKGAREAIEVENMYMGDGVEETESSSDGERAWSWWEIENTKGMTTEEIKAWILRVASEREEVLGACACLQLKLKILSGGA